MRELGGDVDRPAARRRARPPRAGRRRRAQPRALGRRGGHPHLLAAAARGVRRRGAAAARDQRADRRRASVPGAGRLPDAARALGHAARPDDRLRRRRQQRRDVARARRARCSACTSTSPAPRATSCRTRAVQQATGVARHGARLRLFTDAGRRGRRRRRGLHRHLDVDGPGSRGRASAASVFAPYQVNDALMVAGQAGRAVHALPAGAPRRRGDGRGVRVAGVGRLRSGREPAALPEGAAADAAGSPSAVGA